MTRRQTYNAGRPKQTSASKATVSEGRGARTSLSLESEVSARKKRSIEEPHTHTLIFCWQIAHALASSVRRQVQIVRSRVE